MDDDYMGQIYNALDTLDEFQLRIVLGFIKTLIAG